jgi:putative FmdB family regulatory protein
MPKYEYQCVTCATSREVVCGIQEKRVEEFCESCGYLMTRLYKVGAVTFKGDGWASKDDKYEISYNQSDNR